MTNVMVTIGIGDNHTVVMGIVADGQVVCNVVMSKEQVQHHMSILQRHIDLLPDVVEEKTINHSQMN